MELKSDIGVWWSSPLGCPKPTARGSETRMEDQDEQLQTRAAAGHSLKHPRGSQQDPPIMEAPARTSQKSLKP